MAKGNLFLSQARGKVGSVVFYRKDGEQVSRVYTSQVKNPKSSAQNLQRAIFYSVSRMAAGAKYLVEQGQEGVATGAKSRQAFVKKALNDLRTRVLAGDPSVLNVKGNPYMQPIPVSLTNGSIPTVDYRFDGARDDMKSMFRFGMSEGVEDISTYTLRQFFAEYPALGLNKQITFVFLVGEKNLIDDDTTPDIAGLNYRTKLVYDEYVFAADPAVLDLPAFVYADGKTQFNPEVLAPSWGGNCDVEFQTPSAEPTGEGTSDLGFEVYPHDYSNHILAGAIIVSDYTNNKWSRSYSPFAVCPLIAQDANMIAATYEAAASTTNGEEYLDQAGAGEGTVIHTEWSPKSVIVKDEDNTYNMSNVLAMTRSWTPGASVKVNVKYGYIIGSREGEIPTDSAINVAIGGTYTSLTPSTSHYANSVECVLTLGETAPTNGQTTELKITTADGIERRFTIKWVVA